ncbi:MAG: hypothetical protein GY861_20060, partial [bacterium]|nr:hypothetical protein [bacterium]
MFPYTIIPSMMGGTYSNPVVNPGGGGLGGMAQGAGMMGLGSSMAGMSMASNPVMFPLMMMMGGLGGK